MARPFEDQLYQARQFAYEHNLNPIIAHCSMDYYANLVKEVDAYKIYYDSNMQHAMMLGIRIAASNLRDRFWLECKDTYYVVVPDGPTSWRVDYIDNWKMFKGE